MEGWDSETGRDSDEGVGGCTVLVLATRPRLLKAKVNPYVGVVWSPLALPGWACHAHTYFQAPDRGGEELRVTSSKGCARSGVHISKTALGS